MDQFERRRVAMELAIDSARGKVWHIDEVLASAGRIEEFISGDKKNVTEEAPRPTPQLLNE